jgi:RimK-like ATP-grasp domain
MTNVLIVAPREDLHARRVEQELLLRGGNEVHLLDMNDLGKGASLCQRNTQAACRIEVDGHDPVVLSEVEAVWLRRPGVPHLPGRVTDIGHRRFARMEWRELTDGAFLSMDARFVNPVLPQLGAVKPRQLDVARRVGLDVPDTIITDSPSAVTAFVETHKGVVHKSLSAHQDRFLETRRWSEQDRQALAGLRIAPSIFQEEISGPADVRITVVGSQLFAASFSVSSTEHRVDTRLDLDAPCQEHQLPVEVAGRLQAFMRELGLVFGTIDMRIDQDGRYFLLEVNPQGQFLYIEVLTGMPISAAVADMLSTGS